MSSTYTVKRGDTLSAIAKRYGISLAALEKANPSIKNYNLIDPGEHIIIPVGGSGATAQATPPRGTPVTSTKTPVGTGASSTGTGGINKLPTAPTGGTSAYQTLLNQLNGVPGTERDAYAALETLFASYGLSSLAPTILQYLQQGYGSDTITTLLQLTPQYQQRFSGNQIRQQNGLQVLDPADYLSTEASYRQALVAAGIDPSYQTEAQYAQWIGDDISPDELQDRINLATAATVNAPKELTQALGMLGLTGGDITSYFLNDQNPMPQMQQKLNQAQIMEAGLQNGLSLNTQSVSNAATYAQEGVTYTQAQAGYQKVADVLPAANKLSSIYNWLPQYNQNTAESEFLGNNGQAELQRENLSRQEESSFAGSTGVGQKSFAQQSAGTGF